MALLTSCAVLSADLPIDCTNRPVGGAEPLMLAIPMDVWKQATLTKDVSNPLVVTAITLPTGKKAFQWQVFKRAHKPKWEAQDGDYGVSYKHSIATSVQNWTDAIKAQIPGLTEGYNVYIVENVNKSGSTFEIYGPTNGLRFPDAVRDLAANEGVVTGTLTNDAEMNEPTVPWTFAATAGYNATKTAFIALTTPAA